MSTLSTLWTVISERRRRRTEAEIGDHAAELVPPDGLRDQDQTATTLTMSVYVRRPVVWATFLLGLPGVVISLYRLAQGDDIPGNLGGLALSLLFVVLGTQILRCGVTVEGDDLIVRNLFSTTRVPRRAVTRVEPLTGASASAQHGRDRRVFLVLDNRRIKIDALNSSDAMTRKNNADRLRQFLNP